MTDADWDILLRWNQDPDVLYYADGSDVTAYTLDQIKRIYSGISQAAFCFIAELDGQPIAEAWLQAMNLSRIIEAHPGCDCRRIDLSIGEKQYWNKGLGTEIIRALVDFGFAEERADFIFACDIADYNPRSRAAFAKVGFRVVAHILSRPRPLYVRYAMPKPSGRRRQGALHPCDMLVHRWKTKGEWAKSVMVQSIEATVVPESKRKIWLPVEGGTP